MIKRSKPKWVVVVIILTGRMETQREIPKEEEWTEGRLGFAGIVTRGQVGSL